MRYILKKNVEIDFGVIRDYEIAERIGIHKVTLCNILNRRTSTTKPIAFYITVLNGGKEKDIENFFEKIDKKG